MTEALLHLENIYKRYGNKTVLDNVDLSVRESEFCTVVGPSGCGKSTMLRLILGQELPTSGILNFMGSPMGFADTRRGIVYQKYGLYPHMTVLENVSLGKKLELGFFKKKTQSKAIEMETFEFLRRIRLEEHSHKYPFELSGGMQQRVAIAQALIMRPKILLMDEPFGALDPGTREDMQLFILEIWEKAKMTIFFVTHDLEEAVFLGTRLVVLSQYYTDDRGATDHRGAKIVADYKIAGPLSTKSKESSGFGKLIQQIRQEGFDPTYRQHVTEFNLKHPDSFQTLTEEEHKKR